MTSKEYINAVDNALYGPDSIFTPEEQAAMRCGYTFNERLSLSGRVWKNYPQAISQEHAEKISHVNFDILKVVNADAPPF